jgi:hypothetical protein
LLYAFFADCSRRINFELRSSVSQSVMLMSSDKSATSTEISLEYRKLKGRSVSIQLEIVREMYLAVE